MSDEQDFNDLDGLDGDQSGDVGSGDAAPPQAPAAGSQSEGRINDLMSKWQSEQARANRLERELAAAKAKPADAVDGDNAASAPAAESDEFVEFAREHSRQLLYEGEPRLRQYGIELSAIRGATMAEMRASLEQQVKLIDAVESRARNAVLKEHGLSPEVGGGSAGAPLDYASMSKDDFEKAVAKVRGF